MSRWCRRAATVATVLVTWSLMATGCSSAQPVATALDAEPAAEGVASATQPPDSAATPPPSPVPPTLVPIAPTATPPALPTPTPEPISSPPLDESQLDAALAVSRLDDVACPVPAAAEPVTCFVARLPMRADQPQLGAMVELMVALVDNRNPLGIGPVVFLQGGPGVGSIGNAPAFAGAQHDLLFVDQRGTGFSTPKLECREVDDLWVSEHTDVEAERTPDNDSVLYAAFEQCHDRLLADGVDFDAFNTEAVATDYELIRRLFGYPSWSVWGSSYGTRIGLNLLRDYPGAIRAAVLDSVLPFEVDFFATIPENGLRAIMALDDACDAEACAADYGDFFDNVSKLALRLDQDPIVVPVTRPSSGVTFPFRVDGAQLIDLVFTQLYSTRALRALPRQIARSDFGGIEELVAGYVAGRDPERFDLAIALYYTTWCREEFPFYDAASDDDLLARLEPSFGDAIAKALSSDGVEHICSIFDVDRSPPFDDRPVSSDIPTLIFAGAFDPITPPHWSRQVASTLTNATYVELADHGHGMSTACPAGIRTVFLTDPTAPLDTSCAVETPPPDFE